MVEGHLTKLETEDDCQSCDAGFYCSETGADSPTGMCDAGFYCLGGATTPRPVDGTTGDVCAAGAYCE